MSDHLFRDKAPISSGAWEQIDEEASRALGHYLSARKLVDFHGPVGFAESAVPIGRTIDLDESLVDGVQARARRVLPLVELRTEFVLSRDELDSVDRGARDPDLDPVVEAARNAALAEDRLVFNGFAAAGVGGVIEQSPHPTVTISEDYDRYTDSVARAVSMLKDAGIPKPYALALGPRCYRGVIESTEHGGYPLLEHLRLILEGPVVWAPAVDGAVVLSQRGGDYELTIGQDLSIGYLTHDADTVRLYLEESLTFQVIEPRAAVHLAYAD
jgi:uncharacterized linocin/CFP29 family protein